MAQFSWIFCFPSNLNETQSLAQTLICLCGNSKWFYFCLHQRSFDIHLVVHFRSAVFLSSFSVIKTGFSLRVISIISCSFTLFSVFVFGKLDSCIFWRSWWSYSNLNNYSRVDGSIGVWERKILRNFNASKNVFFFISVSAFFIQNQTNSPFTLKQKVRKFMAVTECNFALRKRCKGNKITNFISVFRLMWIGRK